MDSRPPSYREAPKAPRFIDPDAPLLPLLLETGEAIGAAREILGAEAAPRELRTVLRGLREARRGLRQRLPSLRSDADDPGEEEDGRAGESDETRELAEQIDRLARVRDLLPEHARAALGGLRRSLLELRLRERIERELLHLAEESGDLRRAAAAALRERVRHSLLPGSR